MSKSLLNLAMVVVVCAGLSMTAGAADPVQSRLEQSPRHHEWMSVKASGQREVRCWVVYPEVDHPVTTVVVIHENRGLTDWVRSLADQVAEAGYLAVAPDLLSQTGPEGGGTASYESEDAARNAIYQLPPDQVLSDLDAVVKKAGALPASNKKIAVMGFCWGGGKAFAYAVHQPNIKAALVFYGSAPRDDEDYRRISAPVYGFYGGNDFRITGQVPAVKEKMSNLGKKFEAHIYPGAGHAFMRLGESEEATEANRRARSEAWKRIREIVAGL